MKRYKDTISIIGAGSWGTTLAVILCRKKDLQITLFSVFPSQVKSILATRKNKEFLPQVKIPSKIKITSDLKEALSSGVIILATPVEFLRGVLKKIKGTKVCLGSKIFLTVAKGIEIKSLNTPSKIISQELKIKNLAALSGPTIAGEVVRGVPTAATVASKNKRVLSCVQGLFQGTNLRVYKAYDIIGTELAGALKNIIAIACGISDGLGFGTNTKATLLSRGLKELIRFSKIFGASEKTFYGISGIGDLATTCFSPHSRNRFVGEAIGKGKRLKGVLSGMKMVAEGVTTTKSVYKLSKKYKVDMPITQEVYNMLYKNKPPLKAVKSLMSRPLKVED